MRVLVVEDNALLRHHLKVQIQDAGHQVDDAEDAKEADYYLNEHLPDIAIVDLGLPDEDGLSLIRRWRSNDVSQNKPPFRRCLGLSHHHRRAYDLDLLPLEVHFHHPP